MLIALAFVCLPSGQSLAVENNCLSTFIYGEAVARAGVSLEC